MCLALCSLLIGHHQCDKVSVGYEDIEFRHFGTRWKSIKSDWVSMRFSVGFQRRKACIIPVHQPISLQTIHTHQMLGRIKVPGVAYVAQRHYCLLRLGVLTSDFNGVQEPQLSYRRRNRRHMIGENELRLLIRCKMQWNCWII